MLATSDPYTFTGELCSTFNNNNKIPILLKLFKKAEEEEKLAKLFSKTRIMLGPKSDKEL